MTTGDLADTYAPDDAEGQQKIVHLSTGLKALNGNVVLGQRAASQSPEARTGALAALENAEQTMQTRFEIVVKHFGQIAAIEIKALLVKMHNLAHVERAGQTKTDLKP